MLFTINPVWTTRSLYPAPGSCCLILSGLHVPPVPFHLSVGPTAMGQADSHQFPSQYTSVPTPPAAPTSLGFQSPYLNLAALQELTLLPHLLPHGLSGFHLTGLLDDPKLLAALESSPLLCLPRWFFPQLAPCHVQVGIPQAPSRQCMLTTHHITYKPTTSLCHC